VAFPTDQLFGRYEAGLETIYSDDDPVGTVTDQSTEGNDLQSSLTERPTYKTGIIGGQPVYRYDGSNDFSRDAILRVDLNNITAFSIGWVGNSGAGEATSRVWPFVCAEGTGKIAAFTEGVTSGEWGIFWRTSTDTIEQSTTGVDTTVDTVLLAIWDGVNVVFYHNGTQVDTDAIAGNMDIDEVDLGEFVNQNFSGDTGLAASWNKALGTQEREDFNCYVEDVFGITVAESCPGVATLFPPLGRFDSPLLRM